MTTTSDLAFFNYQVSITTFTHKPSSQEEKSKIAFTSTTSDISGLKECLEKGHAVCPAKRKKSECTNMSLAFLDIDNSDICMDAFVSSLQDKPSLFYKTYSNGVPGKGERYRIVYAFDKPFPCNQLPSVIKYIESSTGMSSTHLDKRQYNQYYYGTCYPVTSTGIIYSLPSEFLMSKTISPSPEEETATHNSKHTPHTFTVVPCSFSKEVKDDFWGMDYCMFVDKYDKEFAMEIPLHTPYVDTGDERYYEVDGFYLEIPRHTYWSREDSCHKTAKWKDGEQRHKKIFVAGLVWRKLIEEVTWDQMLYLITKELIGYYELFEKRMGVPEDTIKLKFNKSYVLNLVSNIMNADLTAKMHEPIHSKIKISTEFCHRNRVSKKQVLGTINGEREKKKQKERFSQLDKLYDPQKTVKENLELIRAAGLLCGERTLYKYRKSRGICRCKKE